VLQGVMRTRDARRMPSVFRFRILKTSVYSYSAFIRPHVACFVGTGG
jgi:hypothetical protein